MTDYTTHTVRNLLDAFASPAPLPGGGSAAALTAALGTSLLVMVASMTTRTRGGTASETAALAAAAARLGPRRDQLIALVDEDSRAYQALIDAYRLPKETDTQRTARTASIQRAVRWAVDVPLRTMRLCAQALREVAVVVEAGNPNAVTDARVGATLLLAALDGAGLNVDVNLPGVRDQEYVAQVQAERAALAAAARGHLADCEGSSSS